METTAQATEKHKGNPRVPDALAAFYEARIAMMAAFRRAVPGMSDAQALTEARMVNSSMVGTIVAVRAIAQ